MQLDPELKKQAVNYAHKALDMSDPRIVIASPITIDEEDWRRLIYSISDLCKNIEQKINTAIIIAIIDFDEISFNDNDDEVLPLDRDEY